MKKIITVLAAIIATLNVWADQSGSCGDNVTYSFVELTGTLTISGTGNMAYYDTTTSPWKSLRSSIKTVIIENGVTKISTNAFYNCSALTSVTIPSTVTSIGESSFSSCIYEA